LFSKVTALGSDIRAAMEGFFGIAEFNDFAKENPRILSAINANEQTRRFWKGYLYSLQISYLLALGRIFDVGPNANSIHFILNTAHRNLNCFSRENLKQQKMRDGAANIEVWLDKFLDEAYFPSSDDFRELKKLIKPYAGKYVDVLRPIRDNIAAHSLETNTGQITQLFNKALVDEVEEMMRILYLVKNCLLEFFYNGRKLDLQDCAMFRNEVGMIKKSTRLVLADFATGHFVRSEPGEFGFCKSLNTREELG